MYVCVCVCACVCVCVHACVRACVCGGGGVHVNMHTCVQGYFSFHHSIMVQSHLGYPAQFVAKILVGQHRLLDK